MAHGANVNCLALGQKSGRVLVTGGDDKKVNLWAVGKPNCILVSSLVDWWQCCHGEVAGVTVLNSVVLLVLVFLLDGDELVIFCVA